MPQILKPATSMTSLQTNNDCRLHEHQTMLHRRHLITASVNGNNHLHKYDTHCNYVRHLPCHNTHAMHTTSSTAVHISHMQVLI